ncbi:PhoD-like phosphatase-domain-containing protein [Fusarium tricinctum]|uniref:PhoD-like phosphatase-domain-containing protein n=1 Tax=Fusarium tricinctum TaxID=61284 RepID=A0A8K0WIZ1_9HYPO|nr:PhoD-like phosphatase-domain-containing protein [Fusarium tricinctum]
MDTISSLLSVLDAIIAAATITLRYSCILFCRFHPIGKRHLNRIYGSFWIFLLAFSLQLIIVKRHRLRLKRRFGAATFFGHIDTNMPLSTVVGVLINLCCLTAVLDFLFRGHLYHQSDQVSFSRLGYVDSSTARIVVRAPTSDYLEITVTPTSGAEAAVYESRIIHLSAHSDYVGTFLIEGLNDNTSYKYSTNASHVGSFRTLVTPQSALKRWSLVSSSCIKPFYPYNPLDHGLRIKGLEHLSNYVSDNPIDMVLFLGDFIYIDLPISLGWDAKVYTTAYRQVYASPSWSPQLRSIPWLHVYDDHEIINDWAANETGLYETAMQPFWNYHGNANPPSEFGANKTYYIFRHGGIAFFVLDTRRYRSDNALDDGPEKTMLGPSQLAALTDWLESESDWKVVVSSVPFTRNWRGPDSADNWSGFLWEREVILDTMKQNGGAIILSGDRHEHATTEFPAKSPGEKPVVEFSTSPLNQFYEPFDRFHKQVEETDISIYSHPWGTSKFGKVMFDTTERNRLLLHYDLVVDGEKVWDYDWEVRRD